MLRRNSKRRVPNRQRHLECTGFDAWRTDSRGSAQSHTDSQCAMGCDPTATGSRPVETCRIRARPAGNPDTETRTSTKTSSDGLDHRWPGRAGNPGMGPGGRRTCDPVPSSRACQWPLNRQSSFCSTSFPHTLTNSLIIEQALYGRSSRYAQTAPGVLPAQPQVLTVKPLRELRTRPPAVQAGGRVRFAAGKKRSTASRPHVLRSLDIGPLCLHPRALPANASVALSVCSIMRPLGSGLPRLFRSGWSP